MSKAPKKNEGVIRVYAKYIYLDVVQFSTRSAEAQSEIVQSLNSIVQNTLESAKVSEDDRILLPTGDGMCIALLNPQLPYDSHIETALYVLGLVHQHNSQTQKETRQFQVRIGINQNTDILISDINGRRNIAGAGVNLAARIMDQADGGQILASQAVFHELQPSENYMDNFKEYTATAKHKVTFKVYQYRNDNAPGLNNAVPSIFVAVKSEEKRLTEYAARYFAQAIVHRKDLLEIKQTHNPFWEDAAIVLLKYLATDSYELSKASELDDRPYNRAYGNGKKSFAEQFEYYNSQDTWVRSDAASNAINSGYYDDGLRLVDYYQCFEHSGADHHYAFVNQKGIEKLRTEWPEIWTAYELGEQFDSFGAEKSQGL